MLNYDLYNDNKITLDKAGSTSLLATRKTSNGGREAVLAKIDSKILVPDANEIKDLIDSRVNQYEYMPIGSVLIWWNCEDSNGRSTIPDGWVRLNGQRYSELGLSDEEIAELKLAITGSRTSSDIMLPNPCVQDGKERNILGASIGDEGVKVKSREAVSIKAENLPFHNHFMRDYYFSVNRNHYNNNDGFYWTRGGDGGMNEFVYQGNYYENNESYIYKITTSYNGKDTNKYTHYFPFINELDDSKMATSGSVYYNQNFSDAQVGQHDWKHEGIIYGNNIGHDEVKKAHSDKDNNCLMYMPNRTFFDRYSQGKENLSMPQVKPISTKSLDSANSKIVVNLIIKIKNTKLVSSQD